ncbi:acyl-CoA-binding protein [Moritella yayanosii]|uniref:Acyl-CoA-binding protein n=1 Tax=Moritella yayanosii TaxID=69539 RepID=A0A330LIR1_9GAMM|nr:acyl-CoA-binding protein [Moritella yayanosii]SQD76760.1 Acyl-CoA-binding protein [Moritella yayanosii]
MTDLRAKFDATVDQVQNGSARNKPSQELKLEFYSLFKQATKGDVAAKKPSIFDMVAFAKWTAWNKLRGLSSDQAMEKYIARVEEENAA